MLSERQQRFVDHYLQCLNATEAARLVGYSHPNVTGPRLRRMPAISAAIDQGLAASSVGRSELLARLSVIARGSLLDFVEEDENGRLQVTLEAGRRAGMLQCVRKWVGGKKGSVIEFYSALDALVVLLREYSKAGEEDDKGGLTSADAIRVIRGLLERE